MKTFFDSSAFAKRYIDETGSNRVEIICRESQALGLSVLCAPEIISALNRRKREKSISARQYKLARQRLFEEISDADIINLTDMVIADAIKILEKNAIKTLDALHISCAVSWNADLFVSSDKRQLDAARKVRLRTEEV
ncbi:MAG: type II toxin-antitoxin system VapC family toxin [Candidatus Sumerlaeia bacterium]